MKNEEIKETLTELSAQSNLRKLTLTNLHRINLSSNDYLGLANDDALRKKFFEQISAKLSASSSRLIDGSYPEVMELEKELAKIYGKPGIVFNSGFMANSAIIKTFYGKNSLLITDRMNHASIYEGIIATRAKFIRYPHLNFEQLEKILLENSEKYEEILVISETIYSMDGDACDLHKLIELKRRYHFDLMIDEAHSYGVYGYGLAHTFNFVQEIDFLMIPLGKGGGSVGAYVITAQLNKDYLINCCPEFIYSTANPPINNAWNLFLLKKMPTFADKRQKLREITDYFLKLLQNFEISSSSSSHVVSIIIGSNQNAVQVAHNLTKLGFQIHAIKEPTVPKNTARLRIGLNPTLEKPDLLKFVKELKSELNLIL